MLSVIFSGIEWQVILLTLSNLKNKEKLSYWNTTCRRKWINSQRGGKSVFSDKTVCHILRFCTTEITTQTSFAEHCESCWWKNYKIDNYWEQRTCTPTDILGHILELSMEFLISLCTKSRNALCIEKSTDNLKRNFERGKILKANKWECSKKQDSEPAVGKGWCGSGQPRLVTVWGKAVGLCPGKCWANDSVHKRNRKLYSRWWNAVWRQGDPMLLARLCGWVTGEN